MTVALERDFKFLFLTISFRPRKRKLVPEVDVEMSKTKTASRESSEKEPPRRRAVASAAKYPFAFGKQSGKESLMSLGRKKNGDNVPLTRFRVSMNQSNSHRLVRSESWNSSSKKRGFSHGINEIRSTLRGGIDLRNSGTSF